jgi:hypothetical protein
MKPEKEIRAFSAELRVSRDAENPIISGYAAVFNKLSEDLGGFREKIAPGAFAAALKTSDVRALINHDPNQIVGRTGVNLTLKEDKEGLFMELTPPPAGSVRFEQLAQDIESGLITQQSFGFQVRTDEWTEDKKEVTRTLREIERVFDVSPVTYPAYPDTSIAKRSLDEFKSAQTGGTENGQTTVGVEIEQEQTANAIALMENDK